MTGINKAPITLDLESDFLRVNCDLRERPIGKGACVAVIFQNRLLNDDGTGNALEAQVGYGAGQPWNLLPGQESPVIYANDLEKIYVRTRAAVAGVSSFQLTVLVYRKRD